VPSSNLTLPGFGAIVIIVIIVLVILFLRRH